MSVSGDALRPLQCTSDLSVSYGPRPDRPSVVSVPGVYLDDVIVLGRSFDDHLSHLQTLLHHIREAGLKLNPSKCAFFKHEVNYLGHVISRNGVAPDPSKVDKVATWPVPTTVNEVQQFLGIAGYYQRFTKDFATIAKTLHRLTERSGRFTWSDKCQTAFEQLRHQLSLAPVLAYPDFSQQFVLDTDASDTGIGAVLSQVDDEGRERVITYRSRLLSKAERQYCVTRRELLAVVFFTKQYRPYHLGQPFLLRTDHGSLTWLQNFREPEGQLARWLERLQELDFQIVHRRGRKHTNVDALSHLPCRQCGRDDHESKTVLSNIIAATSVQPVQEQPIEGLRDAQLSDPAIGPLLRGKEANQKPHIEDLGSISRSTRRLLQVWDQLQVRGEVLCRLFESSDGKITAQQVIPRSLQKEILTDLHEGAMGGYLGIDKILGRLKERFYWPGHHNDMSDWCANCPSCATCKNPIPNARAPLTSIKAGYPLQLVAVDIVGPFPESKEGNSYIMMRAIISHAGLRHTLSITKRLSQWLANSQMSFSFVLGHLTNSTQTRVVTLNLRLWLKYASCLVS